MHGQMMMMHPPHGYEYYEQYPDNEEWAEIIRVAPTNANEVCTAVAFDPCQELVWTGFSTGRMTANLLPTMEKYSSVASNSSAIKQIIPSYNGVIAISNSMAVLRSRGCVHNDTVVAEASRAFTSGHLRSFDASKTSDYLLLGNNAGCVAAYDLQGQLSHPIHKTPMPVWSMDFYHGNKIAISAMASCESSAMICAGSSTGQLDLFDGSLRSHRVEYSIPNAHKGSIVAMDMVGNYILTCGVSARSINPYDKNAPLKIYPDPLVKLFDLRTMGLITSIPFPSSAHLPPSFVRFQALAEGSHFYAADKGGEFYLFDVTEPRQCHYIPVGPLAKNMSAMEIAPSGELLVCGSQDGSVVVFDSTQSTSPRALLDDPIVPLAFPASYRAPPLALSPLEPAPASRYLFRRTVNDYGEEITPLSAWLPPQMDTALKHQMTLVVAPKPTKVLLPEFAQKIQQKDNIGFTQLNGTTQNSFLYGKGKAQVFATIDPRFVDKKITHRTAQAKSFDESDPCHVPPRYKYKEIKMNKHGTDGFMFDFARHNATQFVGLENTLPFSYMNSMLQILYFIPQVRQHALMHLCENPVCIVCELGFLFHMMNEAAVKAPRHAKSCQLTNLLTTLRQIPQAADLGLFDTSRSILPRAEAFLSLMCQTLDLSTIQHKVLSYPRDESTGKVLPNLSFGDVLEHSLSTLNDAKNTLCLSTNLGEWLYNDDVKDLWSTELANGTSWLPTQFRLNQVDGKLSVEIPSIEEEWSQTDEDFVLVAVAAGVVRDVSKSHLVSGPNAHLIAHILGPEVGIKSYEENWYLFNDFCVTPTVVLDAVAFHVPWKFPSVLVYRQRSSLQPSNPSVEPTVSIPPTVFHAPSLSSSSSPLVDLDSLPQKGDRVAIDTEFVIVEMEEATLQTDGTRIVTKESRQALARVTLIHGETEVVFADDYILPSEPVVDYLNRFSGLVSEDLSPSLSRHQVLALKNAYMKLRYLVDRGCLFVGHGLGKDFRIVNLFVPPDQIIDTVELYQQPNMRKIALRFLIVYLFKAHIQLETHDSIEDARAALMLHNKYKELMSKNEFERTLMEIYAAGRQSRWKIADLQ
ncbi:PAB-dependent poly(A)-specific ribonuclease subunit 2, partial [Thraustotheca clavata]